METDGVLIDQEYVSPADLGSGLSVSPGNEPFDRGRIHKLMELRYLALAHLDHIDNFRIRCGCAGLPGHSCEKVRWKLHHDD